MRVKVSLTKLTIRFPKTFYNTYIYIRQIEFNSLHPYIYNGNQTSRRKMHAWNQTVENMSQGHFRICNPKKS